MVRLGRDNALRREIGERQVRMICRVETPAGNLVSTLNQTTDVIVKCSLRAPALQVMPDCDLHFPPAILRVAGVWTT